MTNNLPKYTLNKVEELERLIRKNKSNQASSNTDVIKKSDDFFRTEITVTDSLIDSYTYTTKLIKLCPGTNVIGIRLAIENTLLDSSDTELSSKIEDKFTVKINLNDEEIGSETKETFGYFTHFNFYISKYIFDTPCTIDVTISHEQSIKYKIHDFVIDVARADSFVNDENILPHDTTNLTGSIYNGASVTMIDGVDMNGVYNKKYAFSEVDRTSQNGYIYEQNVSDFCLSKAPIVMTIPNIKADSSLAIGYNCMKDDDGNIVYRHLVGHYYSDTDHMANVTQQRPAVGTLFDTSNKMIYTAHQSDTKNIYGYMLLLSKNMISYGDSLTNSFVRPICEKDYATLKRDRNEFQDVGMPLTRNLNDVYKTIYPLIILRGKLYMLKANSFEFVAIDGAPYGITKIAGTSYIDTTSSDVDVYLVIGGYTYKYRLCLDTSTETYYVDTSVKPVLIGYGIVQYQPLYDNDAFIVTKSHMYFTKDSDKIWL